MYMYSMHNVYVMYSLYVHVSISLRYELSTFEFERQLEK